MASALLSATASRCCHPTALPPSRVTTEFQLHLGKAEAPDIQPHSILGFVYTLAAEKAPRKAAQWLPRVQRGEYETHGSPTYELRELLCRQRGKGGKQQLRGPYLAALAALAVLSWNAFARGDKTVKLAWRKTKATQDEPFPDIEG